MQSSKSHIFWYPGNELLLPNIVKAENCYLYDDRGKKYLDLESGVWCTGLGHNHPRITRVLTDQLVQISHNGFNYSTPVVDEAARDILNLLNFEDGICVFLCSGSEAVEYGVRVAQSLIDRPMMMTMADSYFGAYGSAAKRESDEWYSFDWLACADCGEDKICGKKCDHWEQIPFDQIGGFLFEPGSSSGLVRFPPAKLIECLVDEIKAANGFVLVNEVTTGTGRTGKWFGHQHYQIEPDIVGMGKGIGNGYPVSVTAFSSRVRNFMMSQPIKYAQSHQNDPLGAAVVREVIRIIEEENLLKRCNKISEKLVARLKEIQKKSPHIKDIRWRGLMIAVEFNDDDNNSFAIETHRELIKRGFVVGKRSGVSVFRIDPSFTIDWQDLETFLETFEELVT